MVKLDSSYGDHGRQDEQKRRQDDRRLNTGTMASAMSPPKRATPMARGACSALPTPYRNGCAAVQRVVTEGRLPVPGDEQLGTIQELGAEQESPGKIGAVEHRFEEVCPLQAGPRQIRICALCSPKVGASKVRPRKIKPAQIEPAQGGPR